MFFPKKEIPENKADQLIRAAVLSGKIVAAVQDSVLVQEVRALRRDVDLILEALRVKVERVPEHFHLVPVETKPTKK